MTDHRRTFGRLVSALGLYPYQDNPLLRLRAMHGHLMELRVEDFVY
jgi:hypothetical protein